MKLAELHKLASSRGLKGTSKMRKSELIDALAAQGGAPRPAQAASERKARAPKASADERADSSLGAEPQSADSPRREERSAAEGERAEAPRKSRRRRAVIETKEPSAVAIDLPEPVGSSERPAAQQAQAPVKELGAIELPEGDDSEDRGRNRRDRNNRRRNRDRPDRQDRSERNGRNNRRDRYRDERPDRAERDDSVREDEQLAPIAGILDVQDNHAFVRTSGYLPGPNDVYVTLGNVRRWGLRPGDAVAGAVRQPREGERQR